MKLYHNIEFSDHKVKEVYTFATKIESDRFAEKWLRKKINDMVVRNGIQNIDKIYDKLGVKYRNRYRKADYIGMRKAIRYNDIWDVIKSFNFAACDRFGMTLGTSEVNYDDALNIYKKSPKGKFVKLYHNIVIDCEDFEKECEVSTFANTWQAEDAAELWVARELCDDIEYGDIDCSKEEALELKETIGNDDVCKVIVAYINRTKRMISYTQFFNHIEVRKLKLGVLE